METSTRCQGFIASPFGQEIVCVQHRTLMWGLKDALADISDKISRKLKSESQRGPKIFHSGKSQNDVIVGPCDSP